MIDALGCCGDAGFFAQLMFLLKGRPSSIANRRGGQSTPGRRSLAACIISSLSIRLECLYSACAEATRNHSTNGGKTT